MPLEEARALEGIGRSHLQDGNRGQAAAHLRQALTIYQRIGAPRARQVQETLRHHKLHHRDNPYDVDQASEEARRDRARTEKTPARRGNRKKLG